MENIWILGGGQVGQYAVEVFTQISPEATLVVVDNSPTNTFPNNVEMVCEDAIEWLTREFTPDTSVSKIIPALPLHLAVQWAVKKLSEKNSSVHPVEIPDAFLVNLPHPIRISKNQITTSHADFICPSHCLEPDTVCSHTKQQRPAALFQFLRTFNWINFQPFIVRSRQFAPGLGGFLPGDLWSLLRNIKLWPDTPLVVGTACKCHGIIDCFSHTPHYTHFNTLSRIAS